MTSNRIRVLRENHQGFAEFRKGLIALQEDLRDPDAHRQGAGGARKDQGGESEGKSADEILSIFAVHELERLCAVPRPERNCQRCAELCSLLSCFSRLTEKQSTELFSVAELLHVPAGSYVEMVGDPIGFVYIVIMGIVAVEQEVPDIGNRKSFVTTFSDGRAFGDGYDAVSSDGVRHASTVAQEETLVLRMATPEYQAAMRGDLQVDADVAQPIKEGALPWLDGVSEHDLAMLAMMAEIRLASFGESIMSPGDRPTALWILARGVVSSRVAGHEGAVQVFQQGTCFGHGALIDPDGRCDYGSELSLVVDSVDAELHLIDNSALDMLPDIVIELIRKQLKPEALEDPIRQDVKKIIQEDLRWLREKRGIYGEFYRCSADRLLMLSPLTTKVDEAITSAKHHMGISTPKPRPRRTLEASLAPDWWEMDL